MRAWMSMGLLALLSGCAGPQANDPASPHYAYAAAWVAELSRPLTIPRDAATVRLQYGGVVPANGVQEHDPFCVIELETVRPEAQTLRPGRFEVLRVTRSISTIAAAGSREAVALFFDDDPSFLYYITEFRLRDPAQPELRGMRCAWNQMAPGSPMRHLTLGEIHAALGSWMRLFPVAGRP